MKLLTGLLFLMIFNNANSQLKKVSRLPEAIQECSGMIFLNDSTLLMHNDSENPNRLYSISVKGELIDSAEIPLRLYDFEAIANNENILYLGDIGNNLNRREDLKIAIFDLVKRKIINIIAIHYPEQTLFPPSKDSLYFDAEAMIYKNDSLFIFTKGRTKPYNGKGLVYALDLQTNELQLIRELQFNANCWLKSSITDACFHQGKFYLLAYKYLYVLDADFQLEKCIRLGRITQKEAIAISSKNEIFISTERHPVLGGGKLYILKEK
jgi:hypothetical protein